jgi:dTDP-4-dehydrorhamnose reductase
VETSTPAPLNVYGASKAEAEQRVLSAYPHALIIRTSAFFGPWDEHNFVTQTLRKLMDGLECRAAADAVVSPTYVPDLVDASLDLLIDGESGIWHLTSGEAVTWVELARRAAAKAGLDPEKIVGCSQAELCRHARKPVYSALSSCRGAIMPSLEHALDRFVLEAGFRHEVTGTTSDQAQEA